MCATGILPENNSTGASQLWPQREHGQRGLVEKKLGKHYLELGQALDGLQRPQHPEYPQRLDGLDVPPLVGSDGEKPPGNHRTRRNESTVTFLLNHRVNGER